MAQFKPRTEFATALGQVASERGVDPEIVVSTIKTAMIAAYRRDAREHGLEIPEESEFEVEIDPNSGEAIILMLEGENKINVTPPGFGRIAAQTAKQVLQQKIREAEKGAVLEEYAQRLETLVSGMVLRFDGPNVVVDIGKTEALMPKEEQVRGEDYRVNQRFTFFLMEIRETTRGQQLIVSRANPGLVIALFKREVPELASGSVEIKAIAREAGSRTKIAVYSNRPGVDPVGSCVGQKGVRVQEVIEEINGEKIDIIPFTDDIEKFIISALSPATGAMIAEINNETKEVKISVPQDQLSLAIGKEGQNVRLASKLTEYKIDIIGQELEEGKEEEKPESEEEVSKNETEEAEVESEGNEEAKTEELTTSNKSSDGTSNEETSIEEPEAVDSTEAEADTSSEKSKDEQES